jgi:hypothetical protein
MDFHIETRAGIFTSPVIGLRSITGTVFFGVRAGDFGVALSKIEDLYVSLIFFLGVVFGSGVPKRRSFVFS